MLEDTIAQSLGGACIHIGERERVCKLCFVENKN